MPLTLRKSKGSSTQVVKLSAVGQGYACSYMWQVLGMSVFVYINIYVKGKGDEKYDIYERSTPIPRIEYSQYAVYTAIYMVIEAS